jgi:LCP family protein required for cell wall assembly
MQPAPSRRAKHRLDQSVYRRRRFFFFGTLVAIIAVAAIIWQGLRFWEKPLTTGVGPATVAADAQRFSVLVLGVDDRPGSAGRSDTTLVAFVDLGKGSVQLLSLPRDSYVQIPGHGWDKLNAAYAFGKTDLTRQTIENLTGMKLDYTVTVNMQGFQKIVDAVGGVDIYVDENMDYEDPYDDPPLQIHLKQGQQHMDGTDALHYVRFRHDAESDWGRMKRQQTFLKALMAAAKQPANLTHLPTLIKLVSDNVQTNLSPKQLTQLANAGKDMLSDQGINGKTLQGDDLWTDEGYYLGLKFGEMRTTVHELAGVTVSSSVQAKDARDEATYNSHLPRVAQAETQPAAGTGAADPATGKTDGTAPGTGTAAPGTKAPGTTAPGGTQPGTGTTAPGTTAPGTTTPGTTAPGTGKTGTTTPGSTTGGPPWPLLVVDGSGGTQSALIAKLKTEGYTIIGTHAAEGVTETTIVWYTAPAQAANHLKDLLPGARFLHLAPGSGDPPLKVILGPKQ